MQPPAGTDVRVNVLGVGISVLNLASASAAIERAAATPGFAGYVTVTGVHGVVESRADEALQRIHNQSFLTTPDGMPMVWLGRLAGHRQMDRVYGPELMARLLDRGLASGAGHYFFGGAEGVVPELCGVLGARYPGLNVVGAATPPFRPLTDEEWSQLHHDLNRLRPHYLWIGLSTPKQERMMAELLARYPDFASGWDHGVVLLGVGAAFDFHAGRVRQAPRWIQRAGLEWAFRLLMEPTRLWRRYLRNNPRFLWWVALQQSGIRKFELRR